MSDPPAVVIYSSQQYCQTGWQPPLLGPAGGCVTRGPSDSDWEVPSLQGTILSESLGNYSGHSGCRATQQSVCTVGEKKR